VGLVISPESALGLELAKWEQTAADRDPIKHRYPMMLYMAREVNGRGRIDDPQDEAFAQKCQLVVPNEFEEAEDATHQHVVDVQPVKKRGRGPNKPKIKPVTVTAQE
jgi:hypothetical protein